jgi:hypothetical protein
VHIGPTIRRVIYEAIKSEINNSDSIIELSELLRKLGT